MKAAEFIKKFGWDVAIKAVNHAINAYDGIGNSLYCMSDGYAAIVHPLYLSEYDCLASDLKRYVDAYELVEIYKGTRGIRFRIRWGQYRYGDTKELNDQLKQAIQLVEECQ